jgi:hypothetical protein
MRKPRSVASLLLLPWRLTASWRTFTSVFVFTFVGVLAAVYGAVLWLDPYGILSPLSDKALQYGNQRTLYPQIVRSHRFDSYIIGTSTSRLIDPQDLNGPFNAHFANLAMNSMLAWEQKSMAELILRENPAPKTIVFGLDGVWCALTADTHRFLKEGFPDWLYDDSRWNDFLNLLNDPTLRIAFRQILYRFGLVASHVRDDGFGVFVPPESQYDLAKAQSEIWRGSPRPDVVEAPVPQLTASEREALRFPALQWLDAVLAQLPRSTRKILAFMPVHVAAQHQPGSQGAAVEAECKSRIGNIARLRGAVLIDWRYPSDLTRDDANYWDSLHYRLPIAERITRDLIAASIDRRPSTDATYRILIP